VFGSGGQSKGREGNWRGRNAGMWPDSRRDRRRNGRVDKRNTRPVEAITTYEWSILNILQKGVLHECFCPRTLMGISEIKTKFIQSTK